MFSGTNLHTRKLRFRSSFGEPQTWNLLRKKSKTAPACPKALPVHLTSFANKDQVKENNTNFYRIEIEQPARGCLWKWPAGVREGHIRVQGERRQLRDAGVQIAKRRMNGELSGGRVSDSGWTEGRGGVWSDWDKWIGLKALTAIAVQITRRRKLENKPSSKVLWHWYSYACKVQID